MFGASPAFSMGYQAPSQPSASQAAPEQTRRPKQEERQSCLPVTLRMLELALSQGAESGGEVKVHGVEPGMLILVGCVEGLSKDATSLEFTLNDATGRMKVKHYFNDGESNKALEGLEAGRYVSLFGNLRTAPETHVAAVGLRLIQSADEISYHLVEAAHAALRLRRGPAEPATPAKASRSEALSLTTASDTLSPVKAAAAAQEAPFAGVAAPAPVKKEDPAPPRQQPAPAAAAAPMGAPASAPQAAPLRERILQYLQRAGESHGAEGTEVAEVHRHLQPASLEEVRSGLAALAEEGEVYTTIDDEHFSVI